MLRALAVITVVAVALASASAIARPTPRAGACSIAIAPFDYTAREATLVLIVHVDSVGGPENTAPTLTPTVTPPPFGTPTAIPRRSVTIFRPTATHTPTPGYTPPPLPSLQGRGANVTVLRVLDGSAPPAFALDTAERERYQQDLRREEAGVRTPCPPFAPAYFEAGSDYLLLARQNEEGIRTARRFLIAGDNVVMNDPGAGEHRQTLYVTGDTYRTFLSAYPAEVVGAGVNESATITAPRVALADMLAMIDGIRTGTTIAPPNTGSAGLADPRRR